MPLTGAQVSRLAKTIGDWWDHNGLDQFASDRLNVNLVNLKADGSLRDRAYTLINELNSKVFPPRDHDLLTALSTAGPNPAIREAATELLRPDFVSLNGTPLGAIMVGRAAFVNRGDLRRALSEFVDPSHNTTHVLIVRGVEPGGKSYTYTFLRHLAASTVGAVSTRLRLSNTAYSPRMFFEQVFRLLGLDLTRLPELTDDPQAARIDSLVAAFTGQVTHLPSAYWLVIDDLNDPAVTREVREAAYALAFAVEESRPRNLWVALLGYNAEVTDPELLYVAQEDARFPSEAHLAEHFRSIAEHSGNPLTEKQALTYAQSLMSGHPVLSKAVMSRLCLVINEMGEKLRRGEPIERS
ncbi:hypothetical protein [Actinoplanes sp. CA-252034]|uniref:hypothetical protein n=1 Tax=Actinoplanes sp. CA-252034 TaxID=3239906 RepID=UPI003D970FF1